MNYRADDALRSTAGRASRPAPAAGRTGVPNMVETSQTAPAGGVRAGQDADSARAARELAGPGAAAAPGAAMETAGGPLTGVRVLELGSLIAGPFAGRQLA